MRFQQAACCKTALYVNAPSPTMSSVACPTAHDVRRPLRPQISYSLEHLVNMVPSTCVH